MKNVAIFQYQKAKVKKVAISSAPTNKRVCNDSHLNFQAALGVAQEAIEKEKGGIKALQEQLQSGKVVVEPIPVFLFWVPVKSLMWVLVSVGLMRVSVSRVLLCRRRVPRATWTRPWCPAGPTPPGILLPDLAAAWSTHHQQMG